MATTPSKPIANAKLAITSLDGRGAVATLNRWADALAGTVNSTNAAIGGLGRNVQELQNAPSPVSVTDGLIHGRAVWDGDAAVVQLTDDFDNYLGSANPPPSATESSQIGQLGWDLVGASGGSFQWWAGGQYPNIGQYGWCNGGTANGADVLLMNGTNANQSSGWYGSCWALGDSTNWWLTWVFKTDFIPNTGDFNQFTTAQKAIYVGLMGTTAWASASGPFSRPDVFVGLRFDTSAGIGDTFYTFEAVANTSFNTAARHNTQGSTQVTTIAPTQGTWHRLDIYSTVVGTVTMVLDGVNTFTVAIPTITITPASCSTQINNNVLLINTSTGTSPNGVIPFSSGSVITTAGYTGTGSATFTGTFTINVSVNSGQQMYINKPNANIGANISVPTITGRPSLNPMLMFGNDSTVSPTANQMMFVVDYFSFVQNPGVGGGTGTPSITNPRYFT